MNFDDTELPPLSSGIFDTPSTKSGFNFSRKSLYRGGPYDSWTILGTGSPRFHDVTPQTPVRESKSTRGSYIDRRLQLSRVDHVESARGYTVSCRQGPEHVYRQQRLIFLAAMVLTIFFPPVGLLALSGRFDSTISWHTHGELHCLTEEQRGTLKQQLLVEMVLYPSLIITLAVYYSVHG